MIEPWGHIEVYIVLNIIANLGHHDGNMDLQNKRLVSRSGNNAFCEYFFVVIGQDCLHSSILHLTKCWQHKTLVPVSPHPV